MNKKYCLISLLLLPLISACDSDSNSNEKKGDFVLGNIENKIIELGLNELSSKMDAQKDTFFLATHQGNSCTCWTGFQYVIEQYNNDRKQTGKAYLPFYSFDTELITDSVSSDFKVNKVLSGYVDLYVFVNGEVVEKYSKSAAKDLLIFENKDNFSTTVEKHINSEPSLKYAYVSYEYVRDNFINKDNNEFFLFVTRSGCSDCNYCIPNVVTPIFAGNEYSSKIPCYICDIEKYRGTNDYNTVKETLFLTNKSEFGYGNGVVPTYQYWKNGEVKDAGVYGNDSFFFDEAKNKVQVKETYFDGTRDLKYTTVNLLEDMNSKDALDVNKIESTGTYYMEIQKEAYFHNKPLNDFLSYYGVTKK